MRVESGRGFVGRDRAIERVSKLEAVTVARGAAPSEAEFAARRARFLTDQLGVGSDRPVPARIDFKPPAPRETAGAPISPSDALVAAAAYRTQPGERRRKAALRFIELA